MQFDVNDISRKLQELVVELQDDESKDDERISERKDDGNI
jgi:hypothetical protein